MLAQVPLEANEPVAKPRHPKTAQTKRAHAASIDLIPPESGGAAKIKLKNMHNKNLVDNDGSSLPYERDRFILEITSTPAGDAFRHGFLLKLHEAFYLSPVLISLGESSDRKQIALIVCAIIMFHSKKC